MFERLLENYKLGILISTILLGIAVSALFFHYNETGEFVQKGLDFKGGTQITVTNLELSDATALEKAIKNSLGSETIVKFSENNKNIIIESGDSISKEGVEQILNSQNVAFDQKNVNRVELGAALSSAFLNQARKAIIIAFVAMAIVVFLTFRTIIPSFAVMLAGISDIIVAMAGMNLLGISLSLSTLAALLILIGYSIDTDILLSTRVLKNKGSGNLNERIIGSMKTGLTMTAAAIAAMTTLLLVSTSAVLDEIALVIIMGLIADMPFTWIQNVSILKWYAKVKNIE